MKNSEYSSGTTQILQEENKKLLQRAIEEIWTGGNFEKLDEFVTKDFAIHFPGRELRGHEGVKEFYRYIHTAFPDIRFTVENQVAEGDKVATHWTATATQENEFMGIPASGKKVNLSGIDIDRIVNGKVVECWSNMDELGLLQQLGAIPVSNTL